MRCALALQPVEQLLQPRLALAQRQVRAGPRRRRTAGRRRRRPGRRSCLPTAPPAARRSPARRSWSSAHDLAVDDAVRQLLGRLGDRLELLRPVEALAGLQRRLAVLDAQLQAIAVELDLVRPAGAARRTLDQLGELRLDEVRHRADLLRPWPCGSRRHGACRRRPSCCSARPRRPSRFLPVMNGLRRLALAGGDLAPCVRPEATERVVLLEQRVVVALVRALVAMLDQQPVGALAVAARGPASCAPAPSCHAAARPPATNFRSPLLQRLRADRPRAPSSRGPTAAPCRRRTGPWGWCLRSRRSRADGPRPRPPAACRGIERRALGHRPGLEHAVELEAEVVVQPRRVMLLDDEAQLRAGRDRGLARRLGGLVEVALGAIGWRGCPRRMAHRGGFTS